jgi:thymidylate synthase
MGRKTWESIGSKPLKDRLNIVVSTTLFEKVKKAKNEDDDLFAIQIIHDKDADKSEETLYYIVNSLESAIECAKLADKDNLFIIGGYSLYREAYDKNLIDVYFEDFINTGLDKKDFDLFADWIDEVDYRYYSGDYRFKDMKTDSRMNMDIAYNIYKPWDHFAETVMNDYNYLNLMADILENGQTKHTRAGDTLSLFNKQLEFDLREGLPVLTTKKIFTKGCINELLWMIHGGDNIKQLIENNTHIWDDDAYRYYRQLFNDNDMTKEEFLTRVKVEDTITYCDSDGNPATYKFGDLGPIYGKQWTNWNGVNQLDDLIYKLKNNPDDRRLMISSWNVGEMKNMALPPCHFACQFYVTEMTHEERVKEYQRMLGSSYEIVPKTITPDHLDLNNVPTQYLSCMWYQRSVDTCLGLPFDILSYSIFLSLIAQVCHMVPYKLIGQLGDTHIYKNQIEAAKTQLYRNPFKYEPPTLKLNKNIQSIYDFKFEDIEIVGYKSYPAIKY